MRGGGGGRSDGGGACGHESISDVYSYCVLQNASVTLLVISRDLSSAFLHLLGFTDEVKFRNAFLSHQSL